MSITTNELSFSGFDYKSLDPVVAGTAKVAAEHIRDILKHTTAGIIEVGERFKAIKDCLPHGQFSAWIAVEFGMSDRTARSYMSVAAFAAGRTETVSVLQPTTVYALAAPSTPDAIKAEVLDALNKGEAITDREIKQLIARGKERQGEAAERAIGTTENLTFPAREIPDDGVNHSAPEPINTEPELIVPNIAIDNDPLEAAIYAVKILSSDDRVDFDQWYRHTYPPVSSGAGAGGDVHDNMPNQSTLDHGRAPVEDCLMLADNQQCSSTVPGPESEPVVVKLDDDPIVTTWLEFKPNSQKAGQYWVIHGAPEVIPWNEHHIVADRLRSWREAYHATPPERQMAIRQWFEQQQS